MNGSEGEVGVRWGPPAGGGGMAPSDALAATVATGAIGALVIAGLEAWRCLNAAGVEVGSLLTSVTVTVRTVGIRPGYVLGTLRVCGDAWFAEASASAVPVTAAAESGTVELRSLRSCGVRGFALPAPWPRWPCCRLYSPRS